MSSRSGASGPPVKKKRKGTDISMDSGSTLDSAQLKVGLCYELYCIVLYSIIYIVTPQSVLELGPSHCPNGRLGEDLGFGGFAFALKLPELLSRNLPTVRAKLGKTSSFPNGPQIWFPIGQ